MPTDLSDGNPVGPGLRLVLQDALVAEIKPPAGLRPRAMRVPIRIDRAERRAACGKRRRREAKGAAENHVLQQSFHLASGKKLRAPTGAATLRISGGGRRRPRLRGAIRR